MSNLRRSAGMLVGSWVWCVATASAAPPDQVLFNGKILTVDAKFTIAEAVAITGERISAVGTTAELRVSAGPQTRQIDLGGRTVIPGLIDNHLHYLRGAAQWRYEARIDGVTSRREALTIIASKAKQSPPGAWVFVLGGWSEQQFADAPGGFTVEELDRAAPQNPVFIQKSYNATYMNGLAAKELGSAASGGNRSGGPSFGGTGGSGGPRRTGGGTSGGLNRSGGGPSGGGRSGGSGDARAVINQATRRLPDRSPTERVSDTAEFNAVLNRYGLTTVYDVGRENDGDFSAVEQLANSQQLTVRVFHTLRYRADDPQEASAAASMILRTTPRTSSDWHGLIGIGEHTYGPLHDTNMRASSFAEADWEQFDKLAVAAAEKGWHIHEHAMQDTTARRILDLCERIDAAHPLRELRWTLAHCDLISPESIARAKKLGLTIAVHNKTAKPAGTADSPPLKAIDDSGIVWGLGSDATIVAPINPFTSLWWATSGKVLPNTTAIRQPVSRAAALTAHTRSNAFLLFKEADLGSLEVGKLADLVVLDRDYLTVPVDEIRELRPVRTLVGGRTAYESGTKTTSPR